ncbi:MAG TPA: terminase [Terriglobales bacterium]|nr:terminase [Terriglobales bacterium]
MGHDLEVLLRLGRRLDTCPPATRGRSVREFLIRALLRIRDKQGALRRLRPNRVQSEYERTAGRRNVVLKARQVGITTWIAARFFVETITRPGTLSVQVAHDQRSAEEIFRIVHRFLENLPERLRRGALATARANVQQMIFPRLDSEYRVETAADPHAGRGLTIRNLHASEVARWPGDAAATLASLRAAVPPDGVIALESTPLGAGGCFYEEWQRAPENGVTRHFFPWWWEESYQRPEAAVGPLTAEEEDLAQRHGLSPAQIAYRREIQSSFRRLAAQEFAEDAVSCFLSYGECVFDQEAVERRRAQLPPPAESRDNQRLLVWFPPAARREYIIGVDPAGGSPEGDYACAQVIERSSGLQCAEWRGHFTPAELAARAASLAREYNRALLAVERNNHGHGVLAHLVAGEKYENLYPRSGPPGWLTTAASRPAMLENFAAVLAAAPGLVQSPRLLEECRTFVRHPDGSSAAAAGAHDDCVLAMAIALAVRRELAGEAPREAAFTLDALPPR